MSVLVFLIHSDMSFFCLSAEIPPSIKKQKFHDRHHPIRFERHHRNKILPLRDTCRTVPLFRLTLPQQPLSNCCICLDPTKQTWCSHIAKPGSQQSPKQHPVHKTQMRTHADSPRTTQSYQSTVLPLSRQKTNCIRFRAILPDAGFL